MNLKSISFYLSLFCFPISLLAFINILYSSYFDYFLSINTYFITLIVSLLLGLGLLHYGKESPKNINFIEQLILIICSYTLISLLTPFIVIDSSSSTCTKSFACAYVSYDINIPLSGAADSSL